jgi:hypothetical protein
MKPVPCQIFFVEFSDVSFHLLIFFYNDPFIIKWKNSGFPFPAVCHRVEISRVVVSFDQPLLPTPRTLVCLLCRIFFVNSSSIAYLCDQSVAPKLPSFFFASSVPPIGTTFHHFVKLNLLCFPNIQNLLVSTNWPVCQQWRLKLWNQEPSRLHPERPGFKSVDITHFY